MLSRGLRLCLERSALDPSDIDLIVAGASGSRAGDRLEARTLNLAWADRQLPPVVAPKGVTGEYGGGCLAAAVLAACGEPFGPTAGYRLFDPELDIVPHDASSLPGVRRVLMSSLASGGAASWLVLERG